MLVAAAVVVVLTLEMQEVVRALVVLALVVTTTQLEAVLLQIRVLRVVDVVLLVVLVHAVAAVAAQASSSSPTWAHNNLVAVSSLKVVVAPFTHLQLLALLFQSHLCLQAHWLLQVVVAAAIHEVVVVAQVDSEQVLH